LLAVKPAYRGRGIAKNLVKKVITLAKQDNSTKLILWTQPSMQVAQHLYQSFGFKYMYNSIQNKREFKVFERIL